MPTTYLQHPEQVLLASDWHDSNRPEDSIFFESEKMIVSPGPLIGEPFRCTHSIYGMLTLLIR